MKRLLLVAAPFALLSAQEVTQDLVLQAQAAPTTVAIRPMRGMSAQVFSMDMGGAAVVKNSPYSAEAITETVQTLGDGNKITRKNTVTQYRDSSGRTRREFQLQSFGRLGDVEAGANQSITIDDPVAKVHYSLDTNSKTAIKMPTGEGMFTLSDQAGAPHVAAGIVSASSTLPRMTRSMERVMLPKGTTEAPEILGTTLSVAEPASTVVFDPAMAIARYPDAKEEDLGSRNIEGVEAKGTRSTVTIPAGEVGNEREMSVITEKWYSDQLKTHVLTRHSDPRFGETTHKLTNVRLSEPPITLFEVPADFTLQEPQMMRSPMMRKRVQE